MRLIISVLCLAPLFAQQPPPAGGARPPRPAPKNLKLLEPANLIPTMRSFNAALGVECNHCHVQGNFASDDKPQKETARKMIVMARDINAKYFGSDAMAGSAAGSPHEGAVPAAGQSSTPDAAPMTAKMNVTCYTCHHGAVHPMTAAAGAPGAGAPGAAPAAHPPADR